MRKANRMLITDEGHQPAHGGRKCERWNSLKSCVFIDSLVDRNDCAVGTIDTFTGVDAASWEVHSPDKRNSIISFRHSAIRWDIQRWNTPLNPIAWPVGCKPVGEQIASSEYKQSSIAFEDV